MDLRNSLRTLLLTAVPLFGLAACQYQEKYEFESTPYFPQTVTLVNTVTGEKIWTCEVPVGQKLNLKFRYKAEQARELGYDEMLWNLSGVNTTATGSQNRLRVPPDTARRLETFQRPAPEAVVIKEPLPNGLPPKK